MTYRSPVEFIVGQLDHPSVGLTPNNTSFEFVECAKEDAQYWLVFGGRPGSQLQRDPVTLYLRTLDEADRPMTTETMIGWDHHQVLLDLADWYKGQLVQKVRNITVLSMGWRLKVSEQEHGLTCDAPVRPWEVAMLNLKDWDFVIEFEDDH